MMTLKVSCTQCTQHEKCPYRTQLFVNYCGSHRERLLQGINNAIAECRARRNGFLSTAFAFRQPGTCMLAPVSVPVPLPN